MPGAALELSLSGLAAFAGRKAEDLERLTFYEPLRSAKVLLVSAARECFDSGTAPSGEAWLPLKRPRANSRGGDKPLRDTDVLMASVTASGPGHVEEITATSLKVGTNLDYAAPHQFGATISHPEQSRSKAWVFLAGDGRTVFTRRIRAHTVTIPARPFLGFSSRTLENLDTIFGDYLARNAL